MLDFTEITWEKFEDLAERLLNSEGLKTRRLGRGPGQIGKDIIAWENVGGPLSEAEARKWLVECKFTVGDASIGEEEIHNIKDKVIAQDAYGYLLFTNRRLKVNLEETLNGLKNNIGIDIWDTKKISENIILNNDIFRSFFPISFNKWVQENRLIYLSQMTTFRSPLGYILSYLQFLLEAPKDRINGEQYEIILDDLISNMRIIIDDMDEQLKIIRLKH